MWHSKHIVIVVPPLTSILDVTGPLEVFAKANDYMRENNHSIEKSYTIHVLSIDNITIVNTSSGLPILCEGSLSSINYEIDTIIIAGKGDAENEIIEYLANWLKSEANKIRRIVSICAGVFVLAKAGLLDGRKATSHWKTCEKLAKLYPTISVKKDPIFVKDGNIYTSAGISTGIDLSLALVEEDFGRNIAVMVARILVLYLKRPGDQSQFSVILAHQTTDHQPIKDTQEWIMNHLSESFTIEQLAEKALMSPRNFARVFLREIGITPAKYIEQIRIETARRRLEETQLTIDEISNECGFGNADRLRRSFLRSLNTTPSDYRKKFTTAL
jgi:transcriptional regulator GlxA family with amidase domain